MAHKLLRDELVSAVMCIELGVDVGGNPRYIWTRLILQYKHLFSYPSNIDRYEFHRIAAWHIGQVDRPVSIKKTILLLLCDSITNVDT